MADAAISRTQAILEEHGLDGKAEIRRGSVAGEILSAAEGFESDLIVVSTHSERHPSTSRFWRGSVMKRVVRHAACSVFVHNSRYEAEPTEP
jgi:nucleotide-binding universal stress UspA family protein